MAQDALANLTKACERKVEQDQARLERGASLWLCGHPAPAQRGTVSLNIGSGKIMVVNKADIMSVEQRDSVFWVEVAPGTSVIARMEGVLTLNGNCGCDETETSEPPEAIAKTKIKLGRNRFGKEIFRDPFNVLEYCWYDTAFVQKCTTYEREDGTVITSCYWEFQDVWTCGSYLPPGGEPTKV